VIFHQREGETIFEDQATSDRDIWMSSLKDCHVSICHRSAAIRIDHIERSECYLGPVSGSVHIEHAQHCRFLIAAKQIRIHSSSHCEFYIKCLSDPIIEFCDNLSFAPYNFSYPKLDTHIKEASLEGPNLWDQVKDFGWLKSTPSPNWSIVDVTKRIPQITSCPSTKEINQ